MVRGSRGYNSRGGSGRGSYRSSGTYNRMQSNRRPGGFSDSYSGSSSRYNSSYNSYDSRNRDKFQSRYNDNRAESGHKRTYRESSRDRSDDRKRSRQEDSRVNSTYSSSSTPAAYRRTNDSSSRNRASSPATGTSSYHRGSVSGASSYRGRRDGSDSRRHISNNDSMGPPKRPMRSSLIVRPRGGGSMSSSRGMRGSTSMRGGIRIIRKESADIRMMRKKLFYAQQKDRARLLKIARLTSSLRRRKVSRRSSSPSPRSRSRGGAGTGGDKKGSDDDENNDSDGNGENDKKKNKKIKSEDKTDEEEEDYDKDDSVDEEEDKNKSKEKLCSSKKGEEFSSAEAEGGEVSGTAVEKPTEENVSASIKKEGKKTTDDEKKKIDDGVEGKKSSSKKDKNTSNSSSRTKEKKSDEVEEDALAKKDKKEYRSRHERSSSGKYSNKYIKLTCPHCHSKYVTFKEYHNHLFSRTHKLAMRNISLRQKAHLQRLRQQQRNAQREIEEKSKDEFDELKPKFCLLCRLNYRQPKAKHQLSEHHKTMKKFLMPYCSSCHLAFKSPMLYEAHRCSLEHIKRKARNNETESDGSRNETREIDLNKFMTVDSVGEIDDVVDEEDGEDSDNAVIDGVEEDDNDGKERCPVGAKFVKKVEAIYCELCRSYSMYNESEEASIRKHCLSRGHLKAFIRHKEEEQEAEEDKVDDGEDVGENGELKTVDESLNNEATGEDKEQADDETPGDAEVDNADEEGVDQGEDKLWEDVDKDLGDLLREVAPDGQAEDDEEEDESVLNIDIESEKSKSKEIVNGKKEEPVMNNTHKNKEDNNTKEPEESVESAPVVKPKTPRTIKEKAVIQAKTTLSNVQSKVTVASKVVSKTVAKTVKTPTKTPAGTKGVTVKLAKSSAAVKAATTAKAEEKERVPLEEHNKVADT